MTRPLLNLLGSIAALLGSVMLIGCAVTTLPHLGIIGCGIILLAIHIRMVARDA